MKKYTKTQLKKDQIAAVIDLLITDFGAQVDDLGDGGRMGVTIEGLHAQFSRRDLDVAFFDSIKLHNPEDFPVKVVEKHKKAVELEDKVNREIRLLMASESMFAHEESFINYMNR